MKKNALLLISFVYCINSAIAQLPLNLDFEFIQRQSWVYNSFKEGTSSVVLDTNEVYSGKRSLHLSNKDKSVSSFLRTLPNDLTKGKKTIKLSAYVKGEDSTSLAGARIAIKVMGMYDVSYSKILTSPKIGSWNLIEVESSLDSLIEGKSVFIYGYFNASGSVWYDKLTLTIDGKPINDFNLSNFDIQKLAKNATPINIRGDNFDDLKNISPYLANKRLIGLGEGTHGTKEFNEIRVRLIKYLIENHDFEYIALENAIFNTNTLNNYVVEGKGNPKDLILNNVFTIWYCQEFVDLLEMIKLHNQKHDKKVKFIGFDMQSVNGVLSNLKSIAKKSKEDNLHDLCSVFDITNKKDSISEINARKIKNYIEKNINNFQTQDTSLLILCADVLLQYTAKGKSRNRDFFMAQNMMWYCQTYKKSKFILWAHNAHLSNEKGAMGAYLKKEFADNYFNIGTFTAEGTYSALWKRTRQKSENVYRLQSPEFDNLEYFLAQVDLNNYFLPLIPKQIPLFDLPQLKKARSTGHTEQVNQFYEQNVLNNFDGLIFIKNTVGTQYFEY